MRRLSIYLLAISLSLATLLPAFAQDDVENLIQNALAQSESGNLDEAHTILLQAVETTPDSSLAYTRLGGVELLQQDYPSGIKHFQQAIMLDRSNADAFVGMAVAYLHLGRYALAREALNEAERLGPTKKQDIDKVLAWLDQRSGQYGH
ncbi:MAG: tetratricopeptide repeat protein [Candidatus Thiodiazotropha sp. (ex Notomyrtea botanica)]|nr:tetratricopeptide repeat protein [Candidatus Thiodiazotropha sp. (ex Notomyrtea botanica)]